MRSPENTLSYTLTGEGVIPLVLVHGFAESGSVWRETASGLSDICRTVVPDLPGCGETAFKAEDTATLSLEDMADELSLMLDAADMGTCTMVGHSMGGYIALAFAERYPERLSALVLYHSTAMPDSPAKRVHRERSIGFMEKFGVEPFLREAIPALYAPAFSASHPEIVEAHLRETLGWATPGRLAGHYRAMMQRPDRRHVLQHSPRPTLLIAGALDKAVPLEESAEHRSLLPDGGWVVWDDVAHMGMGECPDRSLSCLRDFLTRTQKD